MEQRSQQLHTVRDARPGTAEVRRGVDGVGAPGPNGPWRHGTERRPAGVRVGASRSELEAARHHEEDVRVEADQLRPLHGERRPPRDSPEQRPARQGDHFGHPVARHERRVEPLEREDARQRPALDAGANGCDAPLDVAHTPLRALRHTARVPDQANRGEHAGDVVGVQREDGRAGDECKRGGLGVPGRHRTHLTHSLCEE